MARLEKLRLDVIRIDGGTQMRESINQDTVAIYADGMRDSAPFPPATIYFDGSNNWLADGFHRYFASQAAGFKDLDCRILNGTQRDAQLYAVSANKDHGLPPTLADRRKAALILLNDKEWGKWSDNAIAKKVGLHHTTVGTIRKSLANLASGDSGERTFINKDGIETTMQTGAIGGKKDKAEKFDQPAIADNSDVGPSEEEIKVAQMAAELDQQTFRNILEADDKLKEAHDEIVKLNHMNSVLQIRVNGLMIEKNEAIKLCKQLQAKVDKFYKEKDKK